MTALRQAAQQALEALEFFKDTAICSADTEAASEAITALRAALAEPVQEPVANNPDPYHLSRILHELAGSASMCWEHVDRAGVFQSTQAADFVAAALAEIRQRMKDAPPRREWRGLTEEGLEKVFPAIATYHESNKTLYRSIARAIEAALKERNA